MNDYQLENVQIAMVKANTAITYLDIVCKNRTKKRCKKDCSISRSKQGLVAASRLLIETIDGIVDGRMV